MHERERPKKQQAAAEATIGQDPVAGEWFELTQERINDFADATLDHQFIHLDPEQAAQTPFGGTICAWLFNSVDAGALV